ncbi:unnamed protein product, partial [Vitis vinifera]
MESQSLSRSHLPPSHLLLHLNSSMAAATPLYLQNKPHHHHHHHLSSLFSSSLPFSIKTNPFSTSKPSSLIISSISNPPLSGRKLRAAVIGGGPAGSSAAETLAAGGIETFLFERSPASSKPCGGAIPLCMLEEFSIPPELVDRRVTRMKIISPSNLTVDFGKTLKPNDRGPSHTRAPTPCPYPRPRGLSGGRRREDLRREYLKEWDGKYLVTYRLLDLLHRVFYGSNAAREALVELCGNEYVQRMTFESYLYKRLAEGDGWEDAKMVFNTFGSLIRCKIVGRDVQALRV